MSTTVSYKGNTIATLNNETKTLTTAGTWVEGNITVTDTMSGVDIPVFTITYDGDDDYAVISATCNKTYNEVYQSVNDDLLLAIENSVVVGSDSYEYSASLKFVNSVGVSNGDNVLPAGNYLYFISSGTQPGYDLYYSQSNVVYIINPSEAAKTLTVTENGHYVPEYGDYSWVEVNVNVPGGNSPVFTLTFNNNHTAITLVTCNKTFAECVALRADHTALFKVYTGSTYEGDAWAYIVQSEVNNNEYTKIVYSSSSSLSGAFIDVTYESDGTITGTYPSAYALTLNATTNGTYNTNNHGTYTEVNVNVPTGTARTSSDITVSGDTVTVPAGLYSSQATASVASGTAGTPTATKGTVSNHSISVTPSVTNTTGYITGSTKTGTAVTVTASELASGNKEITQNGTNIDVVGYSTVSVAVPSSSTAIITDTTDTAGGTIRTITTTDEVHLQTKTITPTSTQQTVLPDTGYDGFSSVIVGASSGGSTPSATQHTIRLEFSDSTSTNIPVYYNDSLLGTMITAYTPRTYGNKAVTLAQLDGVTWYNSANIPLNTQLVDYTTITKNYSLDTDGTLKEDEWYGATDYIMIDPTETFSFKVNMWGYDAFYDASLTFISVFLPYYLDIPADPDNSNVAVGTLGGNGVPIPSNAAFIRLTTLDDADDSICSLIRTS